MHESENARVEHRARRFDLWTCVVADIHAFSDQGMAELGQVDPNLMLPPCFEAAFDQGRARERSDRPHVRDRTLRLGRNSAPGAPEVAVGAADPVAAIGDPVRDGKFQFTVLKVAHAKSVGDASLGLGDTAQGRFAIVTDPQGAHLSLYASAGEGPQSGGVFVWDELHTSDVGGAKSFYGEIFGWTATDRDMGPMTYTIFQRGEKQIAGCAGLMGGAPGPHWLPYIYADDVKATAAQAKELGATIHMEPEEIPTVGWIALLQDPVGAAFGLFKPAS